MATQPTTAHHIQPVRPDRYRSDSSPQGDPSSVLSSQAHRQVSHPGQHDQAHGQCQHGRQQRTEEGPKGCKSAVLGCWASSLSLNPVGTRGPTVRRFTCTTVMYRGEEYGIRIQLTTIRLLSSARQLGTTLLSESTTSGLLHSRFARSPGPLPAGRR